MHPSSLLSYYPTYAILDEIVSFGNYKKLNIFIDLKNALQTTYMKHAIENIIDNSKGSKHIDTSVFSALISFLSFHKIYGVKRGIDTNFIIFFETGPSFYHKNIDKSYKISRRIDNLYGIDKKDRDLFFSVMQANFKLVERACNKIPNLCAIRLPNLEADFVPYYILTRNLIPNKGNIANVIYSNDHDLWQCLNENTFIFSKAGKTKKIVKHGKVVPMLLKSDCDIPDEYLTLAMSVIGDAGDDVIGVPGIGPKRFLQSFEELRSMTGTMDEIYERIENKQGVFKSIPESIVNKFLNTIVQDQIKNNTIEKNLKLVSFELISRALEKPRTTEMIDKRKIIESAISADREFPSQEAMKKALEMSGVFLEEASIDFLYI